MEIKKDSVMLMK